MAAPDAISGQCPGSVRIFPGNFPAAHNRLTQGSDKSVTVTERHAQSHCTMGKSGSGAKMSHFQQFWRRYVGFLSPKDPWRLEMFRVMSASYPIVHQEDNLGLKLNSSENLAVR